MNKFKIKSIILIALATLVLLACSKDDSGANTAAPVDSSVELAYDETSDEYCLSCHGSYEEQAASTADLGDWNPHNSIHGGYLSCNNCHYEDKVLSVNYCAVCHDYKPDKNKTGVEF